MLVTSSDTTVEHVYSSDPWHWPLMGRNIIYWFDPKTQVIHDFNALFCSEHFRLAEFLRANLLIEVSVLLHAH